jgi:hypothetical protein
VRRNEPLRTAADGCSPSNKLRACALQNNAEAPTRLSDSAIAVSDPTYILTAELDSESFAWLDALRRRHFPPARNFLSAHLTMFHRLSSAHIRRMTEVDLPRGPLGLRFDAAVFLGAGVAIRVRSHGLERLRGEVSHAIGDDLSRQDAQKWTPHVTVQNKVVADAARRLHQELAQGFMERDGAATGLLIWEYLDGPWKLAERFAFGPARRA